MNTSPKIRNTDFRNINTKFQLDWPAPWLCARTSIGKGMIYYVNCFELFDGNERQEAAVISMHSV
jgi:hypothetical protein